MTDLDEALTLVLAGAPAESVESSTLEFKVQDPNLKKTLEVLADAVVCLANAEGGLVVVGVADRPTERGSFLGVSPDLTASVVVRGIFDRTRPSLSVPVHERIVNGERLLAITVPAGATFYSNAKGSSSRRVGTQCQPFPAEQQKQALASRGLHDWSAEPCGLDATAVDPDEVNRVRRFLRAAGRDDVARFEDITLLSQLRLVTQPGSLTRAGLLLVGREAAIREAVAGYGYAYQYRRRPGSDVSGRFREARPILSAVDRMLDAVEPRLSTHPINIAGGVQLQLGDYPLQAVRELVVNALVHRDYEIEGAVEMEHSADQLTVSSPGGLVFGVTPENILTHPSTPRNRLLLETVTALQVAERLGQGVDRVFREVLQTGKQPPEIRDEETRVVAVLPGGIGDDRFTRFIRTVLAEDDSEDIDVLLALTVLRARRSLTAELLAPRIQRSASEAQRVLDRMAHAGLLEPTRRTARRAFPTYQLTPSSLAGLGRAVAYHRREADGLDDKVVRHVQEYGHITNQTLRRLFDVSVYQARDMLRDLQKRGILRKIDDRSGPGVRYGSGASFPNRTPASRRSR